MSLTPADITNPKRASGYSHVHSASAGPNGGGKTTLWKARAKGERVGPYRRNPVDAAQDYCDWFNGQPVSVPVAPKPRPVLRRNIQRANHTVRRPRTIEGPKAPKPQRVPLATGTVYLIGIRHDPYYVKVGWSSLSGFPRLSELQTGNPHMLVGVAEVPGSVSDEYALHCRYEADNVLNEWFRVSPELLAEFGLTVSEFIASVNSTLETA